MPLDAVARSYADGLYWQELEQQIQREFLERMRAVNNDYIGRGLARSGLYAQAVARVFVWHAEQLIDARKKSLLNAYEKAGLHFDDSALREIQSELAIFARAQQGHATSAMSNRLTQMQMTQTDAVKNSLAQEIERGVSGSVAKANRELTLKRQETILEERRSRANPVEEVSAAKEAPPRKPWDAERLLALAASVVTIRQVLSGSYTVALWSAVIAIGLWVFSRFRLSKPSYLIAALVLTAGFSIQYFVINPSNAPFTAAVEAAIASNNNNSPLVGRYGGNLITPIPIAMYLRIVNLQGIPSTISDLDLQVSLGRHLWGSRRWLDVSLLPSDMPLLYLDPTSNLCSTVTPLGGPPLASTLGTNPIGAHATIQGWTFFDAPAAFGSAPRPLVYRILIKDTAGRSSNIVIANPPEAGYPLTQSALRFGPKVQRPSDLVLRHFFY